MVAVVQRVSSAGVSVNNTTVGAIRKGVVVFLGIARGDEEKDADYLSDKILNLRIFEDVTGRMNSSLLDISGEMLVVSQFTLLADCRKGRRPSFAGAAGPEQASGLYEYFLTQVKRSVRKLAAGRFQAMMKVDLINDGPVTIVLNSKKE